MLLCNWSKRFLDGSLILHRQHAMKVHLGKSALGENGSSPVLKGLLGLKATQA